MIATRRVIRGSCIVRSAALSLEALRMTNAIEKPVSSRHRVVVLGLLLGSIALLIPGLLAPVLTIRGVLTRDGVTHIAPQMLERGINDETVAQLKTMMNPTVVGMLQLTGGDCERRC